MGERRQNYAFQCRIFDLWKIWRLKSTYKSQKSRITHRRMLKLQSKLVEEHQLSYSENSGKKARTLIKFIILKLMSVFWDIKVRILILKWEFQTKSQNKKKVTILIKITTLDGKKEKKITEFWWRQKFWDQYSEKKIDQSELLGIKVREKYKMF